MHFFKFKSFLKLFFVTVIQQMMVAGSSYYLIRLSDNVSTGHLNWNYLVLFLGCLVLVYIPISIQKFFSELWTLDLQKEYLVRFIKSHKGRIEYLGDDKAQSEKSGYLQRESFHVIDQVVFFWTDLLTTLLNVLFNIYVISALLDKRFVYAYVLSAIIFILVNRLSSNFISNLSTDSQEKRVSFNSIISHLWGNLLIANKMHFNMLQKDLSHRMERLRQSSVQNRIKHETVQVLLTFLIMSPILSFIVYLFYIHRFEMPLLIPLAISLHRQVQTVQHIEVLGHLSLNAHALKGLVAGLNSSLEPLAENNLNSRINVDKIQFKNQNLRTLITGSNGAGKSSWLKLKKSESSEDTIYIPSNMDIYLGELNEHHSTGEKTRYILESLIKMPTQHRQTILLDEWDANLDKDNFQKLDLLVEELSQFHDIYEVRHE